MHLRPYLNGLIAVIAVCTAACSDAPQSTAGCRLMGYKRFQEHPTRVNPMYLVELLWVQPRRTSR